MSNITTSQQSTVFDGDNKFFSIISEVGKAVSQVADVVKGSNPVWGTAGSTPNTNSPQPVTQTNTNNTGTNVGTVAISGTAIMIGVGIIVAVLLLKG